MEASNSQITKQDVYRMTELGTVPGSLTLLSQLFKDGNPTTAQLFRILERDPVLVAKMLKHISRSTQAIVERDSISELIAELGSDVIRQIVADATVIGDIIRFDYEIWLHSFSTHYLCGFIMKANPEIPLSPILPIAALLHDIGEIVIKQHNRLNYKIAKAVSRHDHVPLVKMERRILGVTHSEVGAWLLEAWGISSDIVEIVAAHHADTLPAGHPRECALLRMVDWIDHHTRNLPAMAPPNSLMAEVGLESINCELWLIRHAKMIQQLDASNPFIDKAKLMDPETAQPKAPEESLDRFRIKIFDFIGRAKN